MEGENTCSDCWTGQEDFETDYFSRPNSMTFSGGKLLSNDTIRGIIATDMLPKILQRIDPRDLHDILLTSVPNTGRSAAFGAHKRIVQLLGYWVDHRDTLNKDAKIRTFIQQIEDRILSTMHAYEPIFDVIQGRNILSFDDSTVKGNTLENGIIYAYIRGGVKNLYFAFTFPQIRYPCSYGIEMSKLHEFIVFRAAIEVIQEKGFVAKLNEIKCVNAEQQHGLITDLNYVPEINCLSQLYHLTTDVELEQKIAQLVRPKNIEWDGKLEIIFNDIPTLKKSLNTGGKTCSACIDGINPVLYNNRVVNIALFNYFNGRDRQAY